MSEIDRLLVGDVVKVETKGEIVYVELTKIDRYKYGNVNKPRKFHGKVLDRCLSSWSEYKGGDKLTFRKENIYELTRLKNNEVNTLVQPNVDLINVCKKRIKRVKYMKEEAEEMAKKEKEKELLDYVYGKRSLTMTKSELKRRLVEEMEVEHWRQLVDLYIIGNVSKEKIGRMIDLFNPDILMSF